jgi:N-acetylglucosamine-6-phosphate deacetylase
LALIKRAVRACPKKGITSFLLMLITRSLSEMRMALVMQQGVQVGRKACRTNNRGNERSVEKPKITQNNEKTKMS